MRRTWDLIHVSREQDRTFNIYVAVIKVVAMATKANFLYSVTKCISFVTLKSLMFLSFCPQNLVLKRKLEYRPFFCNVVPRASGSVSVLTVPVKSKSKRTKSAWERDWFFWRQLADNASVLLTQCGSHSFKNGHSLHCYGEASRFLKLISKESCCSFREVGKYRSPEWW